MHDFIVYVQWILWNAVVDVMSMATRNDYVVQNGHVFRFFGILKIFFKINFDRFSGTAHVAPFSAFRNLRRSPILVFGNEKHALPVAYFSCHQLTGYKLMRREPQVFSSHVARANLF